MVSVTVYDVSTRRCILHVTRPHTGGRGWSCSFTNPAHAPARHTPAPAPAHAPARTEPAPLHHI